MFRTPVSRFVLRTGVVMLLAALSTLRASVGDGLDSAEWVDLIQNTVAAGAAYAGLGAAIGPVEPFVGNKQDDPRPEVPKPPAKPV